MSATRAHRTRLSVKQSAINMSNTTPLDITDLVAILSNNLSNSAYLHISGTVFVMHVPGIRIHQQHDK
eukprot:m.72201 g.72201  ORF g.72201 m.72201 type:complete len:68 (-) comp16099_c0_seq30:147-350(-)